MRRSCRVRVRRVPSVDEVRAHVASRLVGPKQPRVVVEMTALPHTDATGQIRRAQLRQEILAAGQDTGGAT